MSAFPYRGPSHRLWYAKSCLRCQSQVGAGFVQQCGACLLCRPASHSGCRHSAVLLQGTPCALPHSTAETAETVFHFSIQQAPCG
jgi:hypothetical protein